jgi:hypothetical protein
MQQWHKAHLIVRGADFSVTVDSQPPQTFPNPIGNPTPRLFSVTESRRAKATACPAPFTDG